MRNTRRDFLLGAAAMAASVAAVRRARAEDNGFDGPISHPVAAPPALELHTMSFEHTPMYGAPSIAICGVPKELPASGKLPLIVLLPGGHHNMQGYKTGCWGWWSEYGLGDLDTALRRGVLTDKDFYKLARREDLERFNASLATTPFRGAVYVTPWVVGRQLDPAPHGKMVAEFLRVLLARVRDELPVIGTRQSTGLGGMSSGGLWAIHCGSSCSDLFGTIVATQPFTEDLVPPLRAAVRARAQPQRLRIVTSRDDHQRKTTMQLHDALVADGIDHELIEYLGAHSAEFAAGPGGLDAMLTFDRALRGEQDDGTTPLPDHDGAALTIASGERRARAPYVEASAPTRSTRAELVAIAAAAIGATSIGLAYGARARRAEGQRASWPSKTPLASRVSSPPAAVDSIRAAPPPAAEEPEGPEIDVAIEDGSGSV